MAGGLFVDAHPQLGLAGVVHPQPRVELLRRLERVVCWFAHNLIAASAYSISTSGLFGLHARGVRRANCPAAVQPLFALLPIGVWEYGLAGT